MADIRIDLWLQDAVVRAAQRVVERGYDGWTAHLDEGEVLNTYTEEFSFRLVQGKSVQWVRVPLRDALRELMGVTDAR